jgi:acyl-CoA synthetase (AMP-forming)/AMP-acid ligase II
MELEAVARSSVGLGFTHGLHRALSVSPAATATICNGRTQSFTELAGRVACIAGALGKRGIARGDRVAALALNSDRYLEYYLACPWIGAIVNPINFRWSLDEIAYAMNDSESRVLFVDDTFGKMAGPLAKACPQLELVVFMGEGPTAEGCVTLQSLIDAADPAADVRAADDEIFGVFYTGGTTGRSKGVLLTHRNILTSALGCLAEGAFADGAVGLHAAPMFHLADLMATVCLLMRGGTHVMIPAFAPASAGKHIETHGITDLLMVPVMLQMCIADEAFLGADKRSVRSLLYGASPASETLIDAVLDVLPGISVAQVYGMTETAATSTMLRAREHSRQTRVQPRLRSAGRAFLHDQVRIVDESGRERPRGEIGEIAVRGPNVMVGYLNKPEETAQALRDGWMHTGDVAHMDADGFVYIVDRAKDMIITGGENVYSVEVENVVSAHPAVVACAVIGIPSPEWGESVHAVVVLRPGAELEIDGLKAHCRDRLAGYKIPRSLEVKDALPVSGAGKVLKQVLRQPHWKGRERAVS